MSTQITIIGLGQIGASIGMALKDRKTSLQRVGFDKEQGVARAAETLDVVDQIKSLPEAVQRGGYCPAVSSAGRDARDAAEDRLAIKGECHRNGYCTR